MMEYTVKLQDLKTYRYYSYFFDQMGDMVEFLKSYVDNKEFEVTVESRERLVGEC